jgi:hypothetical protein
MSGDWFLVRRSGRLWGVPREQIESIGPADDGGLRLATATGELMVDEVLGLESGARVRPAGPILRWATLPSCRGLAATDRGPALVIDSTDPPPALCDVGEGR